jgi:hypothetical protein
MGANQISVDVPRGTLVREIFREILFRYSESSHFHPENAGSEACLRGDEEDFVPLLLC